MRMWRKLDQDRKHIATLRYVVGVLIFINILLWLGWHQAPKEITVHIPPDLSSGVTMKVSEVPASNVYTFAFYVWQVVGNWSQNGQADFQKNLQSYSPYLTPAFKNELYQQMTELNAKGQLQDRTRVVQGEVGAAFQSAHVVNLGNGIWKVTLTVRVTERIGNTILQDALIEYPLRVVRYDFNRQLNPWGLALDGFIAEPRRLKTFI